MTGSTPIWVKVSEHDGRVAYMPKYPLPEPEVVVPEPSPVCSCCCHEPVATWKLIRDKIGDRIAHDGSGLLDMIETQLRWDQALRAKLVEESFEVRRASSSDAVLEELADVLEVVDALINRQGFTWEQVAERRSQKRLDKGEFHIGWLLMIDHPSVCRECGEPK